MNKEKKPKASLITNILIFLVVISVLNVGFNYYEMKVLQPCKFYLDAFAEIKETNSSEADRYAQYYWNCSIREENIAKADELSEDFSKSIKFFWIVLVL